MAEVRKVKPGRGGSIAAAIEQAMGASVRPITPGGSPDPSKPQEAEPQTPSPQTGSPLNAATYLFNSSFTIPAQEEPEER